MCFLITQYIHYNTLHIRNQKLTDERSFYGDDW